MIIFRSCLTKLFAGTQKRDIISLTLTGQQCIEDTAKTAYEASTQGVFVTVTETKTDQQCVNEPRHGKTLPHAASNHWNLAFFHSSDQLAMFVSRQKTRGGRRGSRARAAAVTFRRWSANGSVNKNDVTLKLNSDWLTNAHSQERCVLLLCRFVVDDKNNMARHVSAIWKTTGIQRYKCANLK